MTDPTPTPTDLTQEKDRDSPSGPRGPRGIPRLLAWGVLAAISAWLMVENVRLSLAAELTLDELQYANGAWSIAKGEVIYRDFFEHHLPLLHQLMAPLWIGAGDDPRHILVLRLAMLPVFALALAAGFWLNRGRGALGAALTVPVLLAVPSLSAMQTQIRPDALSGALYLAALAAIQPSTRLSRHQRAFLAGVFFALAAWGTLKIVYIGLPFVAAWCADLVAFARRRRAEPPYLLGDPITFAGGVVVVGVLVLSGPLMGGTFDDVIRWAVLYNFEHQRVYPGFPWWSNFGQLLHRSFWLLPAAAVGVVFTVRRLRRSGRPHGDWLLLASLATTFLSFVWQTAPYLYSLIPFILVAGVLAARGLAAAVEACGAAGRRGKPVAVFAGVLLALWGVGELQRSGLALAKQRENDNERQMATLGRLHQITEPDEVVFHQWAGHISRPSAHFFHFLEASTWRLRGEELRTELVRALVEKEVTVYYHHTLFPRLPAELRVYLLERFHPLDEDLWIYGQRFVGGDPEGGAAPRYPEGGAAPQFFDAVRSGRYFVSPPEAAGRLRIEGRAPESPLLYLDRGRYRVEVAEAGDDVFLLWLPGDGVPFTPKPELQERWRRPSPAWP
ncbi:MAG: hypothetical protein MI919_12090 [Holophagales bacterium]|nr:hypothetical protein [Holophagales bacterium]